MFNQMTNPWLTEGSKLAVFIRRLTDHVQRRIAVYAMLAIVALIFQHCFRLGVNATSSLPHTLYLIHKGEAIKRGDYIAFRWHGGGPYPRGVTFIKIVAGVPGDIVSRINRAYYVNGSFVGTAKTYAKDGQPLAMMETGELKSDEYYVQAPHPDSLDSRYRLTGWISKDRIIGRAYALF
jgi:conjugal transfer pilin signal peptidase TrbI